MNDSVHQTVLPAEVKQWILEINPRVIIDGTFGGGGHSEAILAGLPADGIILGLDRDPEVRCRFESSPHDDRIDVYTGSYESAAKALAAREIDAADAMLLDLGLSSDQLADGQRGFSYVGDGELDLRFDPENGRPAWRWLAESEEKQIADAIYQFGEERFSRRIAKQIVLAGRGGNPVRTVVALVDICRRCVPRSKNHNIHPATRTFQALRIVVNDELGILQRTLAAAPRWIRPGGRMVAISFHSLEDRLVKQAFRDDDRWQIETRKPITASESELHANPRCRSAKLRVATVVNPATGGV